VNEYTDIDGSTPEYAAAGNLTLDDNSYSYFYDAENRLTKIEDSASAAVATYKYDAFGRRIEKVDSKASKTRRYYYDNRLRVLEEYDNAPAPARQAYFVWGNYVDELLLVNDDADDDADYYACRDHLYSVHVLYNPTTGIAERYDYDAYGQPTIYTDDGGDSDWWDGDETTANDSTVENPYTFTGRRLDTLDSGDFTIMYYRARYYSPATGRFLSRDPIGYKNGLNLYQYVLSSPILYTDSMGLEIDCKLAYVNCAATPNHECCGGGGGGGSQQAGNNPWPPFLQPLFYSHNDKGCKHGAGCLTNIARAANITRNLLGRFTFKILFHGGAGSTNPTDPHWREIMARARQLEKCKHAIKNDCKRKRPPGPCPQKTPYWKRIGACYVVVASVYYHHSKATLQRACEVLADVAEFLPPPRLPVPVFGPGPEPEPGKQGTHN